MFEKASLFAHSCSPNCSWTIDFNRNETKNPDIRIEVITAAPIKKGEMLTIFYSTRYALYGTLKRNVLMEDIAHFQCKCTRCRDKTELETYMSAVKCSNCEKGYLLPVQPTVVQSDWKCSNSVCESMQTVGKIVSKVCQIEDYVERIKNLDLNARDELKMLFSVVGKCSEIVLHKNHYALQEISMRIIQLEVEHGILNEDEVSQIDLPNLDLFIAQCKYLLDIAHILLCAMTGYIGKIADQCFIFNFNLRSKTFFNCRYFKDLSTRG